MTGEEALAHLGLTPGVTTEEVKARYHELALEAHPDKGGTDEAMYELQAAYSTAYVYASRPRPCPDCGGRGWLEHRRGIRTIRRRCTSCRGQGTVITDNKEDG